MNALLPCRLTFKRQSNSHGSPWSSRGLTGPRSERPEGDHLHPGASCNRTSYLGIRSHIMEPDRIRCRTYKSWCALGSASSEGVSEELFKNRLVSPASHSSSILIVFRVLTQESPWTVRCCFFCVLIAHRVNLIQHCGSDACLLSLVFLVLYPQMRQMCYHHPKRRYSRPSCSASPLLWSSDGVIKRKETVGKK